MMDLEIWVSQGWEISISKTTSGRFCVVGTYRGTDEYKPYVDQFQEYGDTIEICLTQATYVYK
jgi:hypothetical protein